MRAALVAWYEKFGFKKLQDTPTGTFMARQVHEKPRIKPVSASQASRRRCTDGGRARPDAQPAQAADGAAEPMLAESMKFDKDEVIKDAKDFLELCNTAYGENRTNELDDLEFPRRRSLAPEVRRERELDGRPCLTVNKLPTFLHQVTNDQRQNVPGIKVSPVGNGADVKGAEIRQGIIRHIEYASNADVCYDTAVNSAAAIGEGFFRLITDYCRPDSFDQDIVQAHPQSLHGLPGSALRGAGWLATRSAARSRRRSRARTSSASTRTPRARSRASTLGVGDPSQQGLDRRRLRARDGVLPHRGDAGRRRRALQR
jgi:hypothetical protein